VPIRSGNSVVDTKSTIIYQGDTAHYYGSWRLESGYRSTGYSEMYRRQLWVKVVIAKRAGMVKRLPLPVYRRDPQGRQRVPDHPYARLLRKPNVKHDRVTFWDWTSSTYDIFGEAFWGKIRDAGGRPVQLVPLHPTRMRDTDEGNWEYTSNDGTVTTIGPHDVVHFKTYNPDDMCRGLSPLEPLRETLENEGNARRATSSFWRNGARPGFVLGHPGNLSQPAGDRLRAQWEDMYAGAANTGKTVILEEGMTAQPLTIDSEKAQYIETRKLNREEVVAAYDMPPPAVHILDHATFSNITEQFRSLYRDSGAVTLNYFEAVLEDQLRGSFRPGASEPDFGDDVYAEFLLDEVLRGSFEARAAAYQAADYLTIAEKREKENLPFIDGTDRIFINVATQPLPPPAVEDAPPPPPFQTVGLPALIDAGVISEQDARDLLQIAGSAPGRTLDPVTGRSVMGRLSRVDSVRALDPHALVAGLNGHTTTVLQALNASVAAGEDVPALRARIKSLISEETP
jgi:HK97 family phage portal protein